MERKVLSEFYRLNQENAAETKGGGKMKKLLAVMVVLVVTFGLISVSFAQAEFTITKNPSIISKIIKDSIITQEKVLGFLEGLTTVPSKEDTLAVDRFTADLNAGNIAVENAFVRLNAEDLNKGIVTISFALNPANGINPSDLEGTILN
ncbi:MAG: hypothetical protein NTZ48_01300, partial [Candidatus Omnitrophica bacterium]|nr:hypothetical protein [Candidatus Omnitrophota bacterium]